MVDKLVTSLPEHIPIMAILGSVFQQELRFEKAHVSQPSINISKICKKHRTEDRTAMTPMTLQKSFF